MNPKCSIKISGQRIMLCVITLLVMMPLHVHSQEEYTCDWIFNSIPQTGLKTEIFEILGEPEGAWEESIEYADTIYEYNEKAVVKDYLTNSPTLLSVESCNRLCRFSVKSDVDTMTVNCQWVDSVYTLSGRFIVVRYSVRIGNGQGVRQERVFSCKNGHIICSLAIIEWYESYTPFGDLLEKRRALLSIDDEDEYALILSEYDYKTEKFDETNSPSHKHHSSKRKLRLYLDSDRLIFYTSVIKPPKALCFNESSSICNDTVFCVGEFYTCYDDTWYQIFEECYYSLDYY